MSRQKTTDRSLTYEEEEGEENSKKVLVGLPISSIGSFDFLLLVIKVKWKWKWKWKWK